MVLSGVTRSLAIREMQFGSRRIQSLVARPETTVAMQGRGGQKVNVDISQPSTIQATTFKELQRFLVCGCWDLRQ